MPTAETRQGLEDEDIIMSQVRNSAMCSSRKYPHSPLQNGVEFHRGGALPLTKEINKMYQA